MLRQDLPRTKKIRALGSKLAAELNPVVEICFIESRSNHIEYIMKFIVPDQFWNWALSQKDIKRYFVYVDKHHRLERFLLMEDNNG